MSRRGIATAVVAPLALAAGVAGSWPAAGGQPSERRAVPVCRGAAALDFRCFERRYERLTRTRGARVALRDLARQRARSGYVRAACHQLTHRIGRAAGAAAGLRAFRAGDPLCSSGYYHGVVEAVITGVPPAEVARRAGRVCAGPAGGGPRSADHYNCAHGLGHGFMGVHASDVFESLAACDALPDRWERPHCYGGVFMENLSAMDDPTRPSTALRPREPLYPCSVVAGRHREACFDKQTTYALHVTHGDYAAVFRLCAGVDAAFRGACARGLGGDIAVDVAKHVFEPRARAPSRRRMCLLAGSRGLRRDCVIGAVRVMLRDLAGGESQSRAFCRDLRPGILHRVCVRAHEEGCRELPLQKPGDPDPGCARGGGARRVPTSPR